jgi:O-methyltransferase domain/AcrB/AcrD/AcrF family
MDQVGGAVISIAVVLTAVFVPTALVSGISGQFYRQFASTIAIATLISAFNSLTLSPALAALLIRPGQGKKDLLSRLIDTLLGWFCRGRVSLIAGGFFESIPPDGDIYVTKQVLHDWDDPRALAILKNCRRVMKTGAKLLVAELIIPEAGPAALLGSLLDIHMLVVHGGRERTKQEFGNVLRASGYKVQRVIATPPPISIVDDLGSIRRGPRPRSPAVDWRP